MALEKLTDNVEIHQTLGDTPNSEGMTAADLKVKFDLAAKIIKQFINDKIIPHALDKRGDAMKGTLRMSGNRILEVPPPVEDKDATNKAYVDKGLEGKAPVGYGLGSDGTITILPNIDALDTLVRNGWYTVNLEEGGFLTPGYWVKYMSVRVDAYTWNSLIQTVRRSDLNTMVQRHMREGAWGEWEHVNPAMEIGVEYRTTERFNGNPVYTRFVQLGVTASGESVVQWHKDGNVTPLRYSAMFYSQTLPFFNSSGVTTLDIRLIANHATIYCAEKWVVESSNPIWMQVWYYQ